ncbi:hypothetical protein [Kutzneria sp. 744]|uniref:hypothetical protein n=1 Tax=Kutzneria sp. (strain 744) TaxID=345341 RepID=UPI0012FA711B|nr:hypothetical protein [Kutzneria sp. 744]
MVPPPVVAHTFAVDLWVIPPEDALPECASIDDKITAAWAYLDRAGDAARPLRVRVYDTGGPLLHEGPLLVEK